MIMYMKNLNILNFVDGCKTHRGHYTNNTVVVVALWCAKSGAYKQ